MNSNANQTGLLKYTSRHKATLKKKKKKKVNIFTFKRFK